MGLLDGWPVLVEAYFGNTRAGFQTVFSLALFSLR